MHQVAPDLIHNYTVRTLPFVTKSSKCVLVPPLQLPNIK
ncbi:hypothetical protein IAD21_06057 [Abditibacteriota bacterium]|nr:hypothetical protein IAD21_06057 [Abditibacteriota bacterium]